MRKFLAIGLLLAASCAAPEIADLPPLELGGSSGVGLLDESGTPRQAYESAYARLTKHHIHVRAHMTSDPPNSYGVWRSLEQIAECLEAMHQVALDPWKTALVPHIRWYREMTRQAKIGSYGGSFETELSRRLQEIKTRFKPGAVDILAEFPGKKPEQPAPPPIVSVPTLDETAPPAPPAAPAKTEVPLWMAFSAWRQAHADLVAAYAKKENAAVAYERVRAALAALRAAVPAERQKKIALCEATYEQQHEETKGFTQPPLGGKEEDALRVLQLVSAMLEAEYDPDKKQR